MVLSVSGEPTISFVIFLFCFFIRKQTVSFLHGRGYAISTVIRIVQYSTNYGDYAVSLCSVGLSISAARSDSLLSAEGFRLVVCWGWSLVGYGKVGGSYEVISGPLSDGLAKRTSPVFCFVFLA